MEANAEQSEVVSDRETVLRLFIKLFCCRFGKFQMCKDF